MQTRVLHGPQIFEGIQVSFIPIETMVTEEYMLMHDGQRMPDAEQKAITITHLRHFVLRWAKIKAMHLM